MNEGIVIALRLAPVFAALVREPACANVLLEAQAMLVKQEKEIERLARLEIVAAAAQLRENEAQLALQTALKRAEQMQVELSRRLPLGPLNPWTLRMIAQVVEDQLERETHDSGEIVEIFDLAKWLRGLADEKEPSDDDGK